MSVAYLEYELQICLGTNRIAQNLIFIHHFVQADLDVLIVILLYLLRTPNNEYGLPNISSLQNRFVDINAFRPIEDDLSVLECSDDFIGASWVIRYGVNSHRQIDWELGQLHTLEPTPSVFSSAHSLEPASSIEQDVSLLRGRIEDFRSAFNFQHGG